MMLVVHKAWKPSIATKLNSDVIGLHKSLEAHFKNPISFYGYHQPCDLLDLSYGSYFPYCENMMKLNVGNKMINDTLSCGVTFCGITYCFSWHK